MHGVALAQDGRKHAAGEDVLQRRAQLRFPARTQRMFLQLREQRLHVVEPTLPQRAYFGHQRQCLAHALLQHFGRGDFARVVVPAQGKISLSEKLMQRVAQLDLVLQAELDVDALDAVGVLGHARQWDHHVLVDLERVRVPGNRRRALAIEPEFLARLGADGDKAFAAA